MPSSQGWWLAGVGLMSVSSTTIADTVQNCGVGKTCRVGCFDLQPELTLFTASPPLLPPAIAVSLAKPWCRRGWGQPPVSGTGHVAGFLRRVGGYAGMCLACLPQVLLRP